MNPIALLEANKDRVKAQKILDDVDAGKLNLGHDQLYEVVMEATGSKDLANAYANAAIMANWKQR